jgi:hypothetical protein
MQTTGHEIQQLPTKLMREAGLEELQDLEKEVRSTTNQIRPPSVGFDEKQIFDSAINPPASPPPKEPESPSAPPADPQP